MQKEKSRTESKTAKENRYSSAKVRHHWLDRSCCCRLFSKIFFKNSFSSFTNPVYATATKGICKNLLWPREYGYIHIHPSSLFMCIIVEILFHCLFNILQALQILLMMQLYIKRKFLKHIYVKPKIHITASSMVDQLLSANILPRNASGLLFSASFVEEL